MTIIDTAEAAQRLGKSVPGISKAARAGRFGATAHRDERGRWMFEWPAAKVEFEKNTDTTRYSSKDWRQRPAALAPAPSGPVDWAGKPWTPDPEIVAYFIDLRTRVLAAAAWDDEDKISIVEMFDDVDRQLHAGVSP